jgi:hypothetical protein
MVPRRFRRLLNEEIDIGDGAEVLVGSGNIEHILRGETWRNVPGVFSCLLVVEREVPAPGASRDDSPVCWLDALRHLVSKDLYLGHY